MAELQAKLTTVQGLSATLSSEIYIKMQDKTVTPTEEAQTVVADDGYNGLSQVTVNAIPNQYVDTSDADATAQDILQDKTAYVNGEKVTGTFVFDKTKYGISIDDMFGSVNSSGVYSKPSGNIYLTITGFKSVAQYGLTYQFTRNNAIKSITFADLEQITTANALQYMCNFCTGLISASFPKLATISGSTGIGYAFYSCTSMTTANFSALTTASGTTALQYIFYGCNNLESVDFSALKTIGSASAGSTANNRQFYNAFYNCNKLTSISFPSLESIYCNGTAASYGTFASNNNVQKFYFPKLTTIAKTGAYTNTLGCNNVFSSCSALTEIHFGAENRSAIESTTGYSTKWGAPSTCTIYFDL